MPRLSEQSSGSTLLLQQDQIGQKHISVLEIVSTLLLVHEFLESSHAFVDPTPSLQQGRHQPIFEQIMVTANITRMRKGRGHCTINDWHDRENSVKHLKLLKPNHAINIDTYTQCKSLFKKQMALSLDVSIYSSPNVGYNPVCNLNISFFRIFELLQFVCIFTLLQNI